MNIGDKIYHIQTTSNVFSRKKITMIDDKGIQWYRYDKDIQEFELETHTIIGKISVTVEGIVDENVMTENEYHTDKIMTVYEADFVTEHSPYWFSDEAAAQKKLTELREHYAD
jgi:hypothetical protein